ncbi:hypothetical protein E3Q23_03438 [Wallemia mellicola]|uniref:Uncharacterized protein n=1 Tax=Wallemia mellicola TaxID=1708541 RepID=A0A4T0MVN4_9BASI|nr:hypothetical protein E3Q23_03438 [Wallemia mellicola]TIB87904.1 hypothetical protein E3Q19_03462 [Wallemia mellicola]TIC25605.1 hypothetical protein E3Q11_03346 [Wallemia mellicola]TIC27868.1 hypothetical protein E3Q10_03503 [Wallemia mellicola]TIC63372.1 hypothetical protein E3Q01_03400 [Wallemia mellicola]
MDERSSIWTLDGFRNETQEDAMPKHIGKQRYIKKEATERRKVLKSHRWYTGDKLRYLHLQAQQVVLRYQVRSLMSAWNLPPEFEAIVKDLWALRLSLLKDLVAAPLELGLKHQRGEHTDEDDDLKDDTSEKDEKDDDDDKERVSDIGDPDEMLEKPWSDDDDDIQMPQTMEEALEAAKKIKTARRTQNSVDEFNMIWLLATLNLAFWTLRLPVFYLDFKNALETRVLPYMDALSCLPETMKERLNPGSRSSFQAEAVPSLRKIHRASIYLARQYDEKYNITFNDYNSAPILWRCVHDMGLPPRIYTLCQEMLKRLDTHFTLLPKRKVGKRSRHRNGESSAPEIITMSVVVTMCTLVYNLENEITFSDQPRVGSLLDKNKWLLSLEEHFKKSDTILNDQIEIIDATDEQIEDFLDFMEKTIPPANEETVKTWPTFGEDLVSRGDPMRVSAIDKDKDWFHKLYEDRIPLHDYPSQSDSVIIRSYHTSDVLGDYPKLLDKLLKASAKAIGIAHIEEIARLVELFQKRLVWRRNNTSLNTRNSLNSLKRGV